MDENRRLTKREKKELRKEEKLLEREEYRKSKTKKRIILWGSILLGLVAIVFIVAKLATAPSKTPEQTPNQTLAPIEKIDWSKGNASAAATLVEYGDFQCPACKAYETIVTKINTELKDKVHFVYRYFPLRNIHKNAQLSAQAGEAAGKQNKFWEMHDLLYDKQTDWAESDTGKDIFLGYAKDLGLNIEQFKKDFESEAVINRIERDYQSGTTAGVDSTPSFYLNGAKIENPQSYDDFKQLIEKTSSH